MNFKTMRKEAGMTLKQAAKLSGYTIGAINGEELHGNGSDRLKAKLTEIYGFRNQVGVRQYPQFDSQAAALNGAPAEFLIDDVLAEVQTIKESIAALEQKLKKLKP